MRAIVGAAARRQCCVTPTAAWASPLTVVRELVAPSPALGRRAFSQTPAGVPTTTGVAAANGTTLGDTPLKGPATGATEPSGTNSGSSAGKPQHNNSRGPISWPSLGLMVVIGSGLVVYYNYKRSQVKSAALTKVETFGKAALGGPWSLVDADGRPMTSGDLLGKYYLVYFGFANCPDICPNELVKVSRALDMYEKKSKYDPIVPLFITLDPSRDSCAQVGSYVKDFHPRMIGLTGTPRQIAKVAKRFRVYYSEVDKLDDSEDYLVDHSIVSYLMGPDGEFIDFYSQLMSASEMGDKLAATVERLELEAGRGPKNQGFLGWLRSF